MQNLGHTSHHIPVAASSSVAHVGPRGALGQFASAVLVVVGCTALVGCMFQDVREQQTSLKNTCSLTGDVNAARAEASSIVVILLRRSDGDEASVSPWSIVDHFVVQRAGTWRFSTRPGSYRVAAFDDANADLVYQPGEAFVDTDRTNAFACTSGDQARDLSLSIPASPIERFDKELDVAALQSQGSRKEDLAKTMGQATAVGEIAALSDPRFSQKTAEDSMWRPYDFIMNSRPGVYFLEPYDTEKVVVLFVHGINGTPANFSYLIDHLDRTHFQPWVYSYPSGIYLSSIADHLNQTIAKLQTRHHLQRLVVVAHSMGGLVARGFLLRQAKESTARAPMFISISTPWAGHDAAELGVKHAPVVVDVWRDMVPESDYLRSLFATSLPDLTDHHLIFTFRRKSMSLGVSGDETVTVASQLYKKAQRESVRMYGIDDTHDGGLQNEIVADLLNQLLASLLTPATKPAPTPSKSNSPTSEVQRASR